MCLFMIRWRLSCYIRETCMCRPCTYGKTFLTIVGSAVNNHKYAAGQRIVRFLIRHDILIFYYRTGRFHVSRNVD